MAGDYSDLDQFPETWELKRIGDFASVKGGKRLPTGTALVPTRTNHPYLRIVDFKDRGIDKSGLMFVPDDVFPQIARYIISSRDIYVSIVGTIGLVGVVDKSLDGANLTENAAKICNIADDVDRDYLAAFLGSGWGQHQIGALTVGSTQPKLALFRIGDIRVPLPPLAEQKAIAAVLGALDDKIELNRRMNATLEAMARALFKSWFVDFDPVRAKLEGRPPAGMDAATAALFPDHFQDSELGQIPKGWEVGPILRQADLLSGGTPKTDVPSYWGGEVPWASAKDVSQCGEAFLVNTERTITRLGVAKSATKIIPALATVIVARGATTGRLTMFGHEMAMNQTCYSLRSKSGAPFSLYCHARDFSERLVQGGHGSIFDTITTSTFEATDVILPPKELLLAFDRVTGPMFDQILSNLHESRDLATLRDTLLPKLLSGEVQAPVINS